MRPGGGEPSLDHVDEFERLLRRLALNDEDSLRSVLRGESGAEPSARLDEKLGLLVTLAALLALGAATASLRATVQRAREAGATESEIVEVLVAVSPAVGFARVVATAPRLAMALGYDLDADE